MKINLPSDKRLAVISRFMSFGTRYAVVIIPITEEEEVIIDNGRGIVIGNGNIFIDPSFTYCYGELNFNNDDDIDIINACSWITESKGETIPAHYDYETHTCESINLSIGIQETFDNLKLIMYAHGCIGKPKRSLVFKIRNDDVKKIFD